MLVQGAVCKTRAESLQTATRGCQCHTGALGFGAAHAPHAPHALAAGDALAARAADMAAAIRNLQALPVPAREAPPPAYLRTRMPSIRTEASKPRSMRAVLCAPSDRPSVTVTLATQAGASDREDAMAMEGTGTMTMTTAVACAEVRTRGHASKQAREDKTTLCMLRSKPEPFPAMPTGNRRFGCCCI